MSESKFPYFLLGLGIGAAVGILFAPKAGMELRAELRSRAEDERDRMRQRGEDLRHQAEDFIERGRGAVQSQRDQLAAAFEAGKRAYRETTAEPAPAAEPEAPTTS